MFRHNFILIFRNFKKFKGTFLINLIGLSTGLTSALLIFLWIHDEMSVDRFGVNDDRRYQILQNSSENGIFGTCDCTPGILANALAQEIPEVEYAASVVPPSWFSNKGVIKSSQISMRAAGQFVSKDYFQVFPVKILQGNKASLLPDQHSVVISEELALKLFHTTENIIGRTFSWSQEEFVATLHITGIFQKQDIPVSIDYDLLLNYEYFFAKRPSLQYWGNSDPYTFVLLRSGANVSAFNQKIKHFMQKKDKEIESVLFAQQYSDKYLHGRYANGIPVGGRIEYIALFATISVFILVIACINSMNLSTAKAARRLKEVGIKKAVGAARRNLVSQYLFESVMMSVIAMMIAVLLADLLLPAFNVLTSKHLTLKFNGVMIAALACITLVTGILAGSYPALYLSGFNAITMLRGKFTPSFGELWARRGLVVFQFTISVVLIVSVLVVYRQIKYVQERNLGYSRENIVLFEMEMTTGVDDSYFERGGPYELYVKTFVDKVSAIPGVVKAANFYHDLTGKHGGLSGIDWEAGEQDEDVGFCNLEAGYNFLETLGVKMVAGRSFSPDYSNDRGSVIFNKAAIERMGLKEPIGKTITLWGDKKIIVGVTDNFHFESLYEDVKPCVMQFEPRSNKIMVKIQAGQEQETIAKLQALHAQYSPGLPFEYHFLDDDYHALYIAEQNVSVLSRYFAGIAIVISCLGLFALVAFTAERRVKEIGIRKVLGATELGIVLLLSADFTKIVIAAIIIALPISYFVAKAWLEHFVFHIPLQGWYFIAAGIIALVIAWTTVGLQAFRAARINPVKCLKDE
jgi:putative ABC transport system permease protein